MIPASEGYPQYSGSLIKPVMSTHILTRLKCETAFREFTTGNFLGELKGCTDTVTMLRAPRASVRPYQKNQKLETDYLETSSVSLSAGKAAYFDIKIDFLDEKQICNSSELLSMYTDDAIDQFKFLMEMDVLGEMMCNVDAQNQGCCAGAQTHSYNLGSDTKPLILTCDGHDDTESILSWLEDVMSVLMESCAVTPGMGYNINNSGGEPFIALPIKAYNLLKKCLSAANGCNSVENTPMVTGRIPNRINGFHVFILPGIPNMKKDLGNGVKDYVYKIIAGRRDATGFINIVDHVRKLDTDPEYFGTRIQGLTAWGTATLRPEALTLSRVVFSRD